MIKTDRTIDLGALEPYLAGLDADARNRVLSAPLDCWGFSPDPEREWPETQRYCVLGGSLCLVDHATGRTATWADGYDGPAAVFDDLCNVHGLVPVVVAIKDALR